MPRQIILFACFAFICVVLRKDAKRQPDVSYALWLPWLWFGIISSRAISYWFGMGVSADSADYYLDGSPFDRNVFIALIILGIAILWNRKTEWSNIIKNNKFIFIYVLYLGLSTLWSDFTFVSFKRWVKEFGHITMILIIMTEHNPYEAFATMIKRLAYILIPLSVVFNKYFPEIGRMYSQGGGDPQFIGVAQHKNSLGAICVIFGLVLFWKLLALWHSRKENKDTWEITIHVGYLAMIVSLLYSAQSATAIICAIVGTFIIIALNLPIIKNNTRAIKYYILFLALILLIIHLLFDLTALTATSVGRDETLTGRTQIWEDVLAMKTNPLIGTGYQSFWLGERAEYFWNKYWWHPNQAHNGYLEAYINIGMIGLCLLFIIIISDLINIFAKMNSKDNYDFQVLRITFLVIFLMVNITEASLVGLFWLTFLFISFQPPRLINSKLNNSTVPINHLSS